MIIIGFIAYNNKHTLWGGSGLKFVYEKKKEYFELEFKFVPIILDTSEGVGR